MVVRAAAPTTFVIGRPVKCQAFGGVPPTLGEKGERHPWCPLGLRKDAPLSKRTRAGGDPRCPRGAELAKRCYFGHCCFLANTATSKSLGDGVVKPVGSRIEWAELLRRLYWVDVLACPCGGGRAMVADISDRNVVVAILAHLGLPPFAPPGARARSPAFELS